MSDEEEYKPKLKPVMPQAPDFHTLLDDNGRPRQPARGSRRMKFLGLTEPTSPLGYGGGNELFVHGDADYDMASGPRPPRTRRPNPEEWADGIMTDLQADTVREVSKARKGMGKQKSLGKKRGRKKSN